MAKESQNLLKVLNIVSANVVDLDPYVLVLLDPSRSVIICMETDPSINNETKQ
jgi:hypothetical protein